ncbi:hypothetical protein HYPSUDRAFT_81411 [Hypholoma sublateritium FD-334 SS-4]|uniref:Uncharacterized protein n=1 Tax=Hypholoma sublateritium (strain FD-334 SS-4) TaxID=945553 RepID=A0A0D2QDV6_HYPSF|nr:hypothetical protein HYPSUDRAFT_81411 [Hypholoma sublateritium FD-334 SS-4]
MRQPSTLRVAPRFQGQSQSKLHTRQRKVTIPTPSSQVKLPTGSAVKFEQSSGKQFGQRSGIDIEIRPFTLLLLT